MWILFQITTENACRFSCHGDQTVTRQVALPEWWGRHLGRIHMAPQSRSKWLPMSFGHVTVMAVSTWEQFKWAWKRHAGTGSTCCYHAERFWYYDFITSLVCLATTGFETLSDWWTAAVARIDRQTMDLLNSDGMINSVGRSDAPARSRKHYKTTQ